MPSYKLKVTKRLAEFGRTGNRRDTQLPFRDLNDLLRFISGAREAGDITQADEFFAMAALGQGHGTGAAQHKGFLESLARSAADLFVTHESETGGVGQTERAAFERAFVAVKPLIRRYLPPALAAAKKKWATAQLTAIIRQAESAIGYRVAAYHTTPDLTSDDMKLAAGWGSQDVRRAVLNFLPDRVNGQYRLPFGYGRNWELGRALSARAAEKIVTSFYEQYGHTVKDISLSQLEGGDGSWKLFDLQVSDGDCIDVKNSRRARRDSETYVEHCVPQFKQARSGVDVAIFGVLSPYLPASEFFGSSGEKLFSPVVCLGKTTYAMQTSLKAEFEEGDFIEINFNRPGEGANYFLPAWMFDYPGFVYAERDEALASLGQLKPPALELWNWAALEPPIPVLIAAGADLSHFVAAKKMESWEQSLVAQMLSRRRRFGLSLPALFLTLLTHFLRMTRVRSDKVTSFRPACYRRFIFFNDKRYARPLCIFDPLHTINSLISALDILWEAEHGLVSKFQVFRLQSFNILLGKMSAADNNWKTLIAYCGGWLNPAYGGGRKCGKAPLILGQTKSCLQCGKLVCPDCGFCCKPCGRA